MLLRPFLNDAGSCASYLFGCTTHDRLAVVDAHADLVDEYLASAAVGSPIVAVFETHVQADHVSCRRWSSARARPHTSPQVHRSSSSMSRLMTATWSSLGTPS